MDDRRSSYSQASLTAVSNNKTDRKQRKSLAAMVLSSLNFKSRSASLRRTLSMQENHESVVFIWFDQQQLPSSTSINSLRSINDSVRLYPEWYPCLETMRTLNEKIFFISLSMNNELIKTAHEIVNVEAIFLLNDNAENMESNSPKICGRFSQRTELFQELRETLDIFEQVQLEFFAFEDEQTFLWRQHWKRDVSCRFPPWYNHSLII